VLGQEGAGVVNAVGASVTTVKNGDRVAWTGLMGS
jgi:Zn-dependent alcohol dehydrogenase